LTSVVVQYSDLSIEGHESRTCRRVTDARKHDTQHDHGLEKIAHVNPLISMNAVLIPYYPS